MSMERAMDIHPASEFEQVVLNLWEASGRKHGYRRIAARIRLGLGDASDHRVRFAMAAMGIKGRRHQ